MTHNKTTAARKSDSSILKKRLRWSAISIEAFGEGDRPAMPQPTNRATLTGAMAVKTAPVPTRSAESRADRPRRSGMTRVATMVPTMTNSGEKAVKSPIEGIQNVEARRSIFLRLLPARAK